MSDFNEARERMVERQLVRRGICDSRVLDAMRRVPREAFVPDCLRDLAYEDRPLPIGNDQTISQPAIVATMIEAAELSSADIVLDGSAVALFLTLWNRSDEVSAEGLSLWSEGVRVTWG